MTKKQTKEKDAKKAKHGPKWAYPFGEQIPTSKDKKKDPKDAKIAELTEISQRLQAEFENFKKRNEKQCKEFQVFAETELINQLLPILDSFELALKQNKDHGFQQIYAQFLSTLEKRGLKKIPTEGIFNPHLHEVMLTENVPKVKDQMILQELQTGYIFKEKVIRTAKVKVNKI